MTGKSRVLVADDHSVVLEGIKALLEDEPDFEVAGTAQNGLQTLSLMKTLKPDIVILDISMPELDGIEAAFEVRKRNPNARILIYSMNSSKDFITALFKLGISGYVLKEEPLSELLLALRALRGGATFYSSKIHKVLENHMKELERGYVKPQEEDAVSRLSVREREIFVLLADGVSVKEVANRLCISPKTVESHKYNIMEKLKVSSLAEFTKIAIRRNLINV